MAPGADVTPARIPKLKYRIPLSSNRKSPSFQPSQDTAPPPCVQERPATPDSTFTSPSSRPSSETAGLTPPSLASASSSATSSDDSKSSKKKKKTSSVLGFFSLKEPSHIALEQYAEKHRKQTATKELSTPYTRHSSTFARKHLPPNVPKVNSKWDGVPDVVKNQHSTSSTSPKDKRSSWPSQSLVGAQLQVQSWMTDDIRDPPNSIASAASSVSDFTIGDRDQPIEDSPSPTTLPDMPYNFPDAPAMSGALPTTSLEADTSHESVDRPPRGLPNATFDASQLRDEFGAFRADSPTSSTDSVDTIVRDTAEAIFKKLNHQPRQTIWGGDALAGRLPDNSKLEHVPNSHDFLFGPPSVEKTPTPTRPVQNFSRPMASSNSVSLIQRPSTYRSSRPTSSALPTLYEASLASTESLATVQNDRDTGSIAPSTVAPSELSKHWHDSPRDRLGLGGHLRLNDVLPWDKQGDPLGKPKKNRLSIFGIGVAKA